MPAALRRPGWPAVAARGRWVLTHELSIAVELVETAAAEARRLGAVRVRALHVRIGPLSGVVPRALAFSFDLAATGTEIEGARLDIEAEAVTVWCEACSRAQPLTDVQSRRCPVCDRPAPRILSGAALELTAMEVEDATTDR